MKVHFSSKTCEWATPQDLFDKYNDFFQFELDVCATSENAKCDRFYTKEDNGLEQPWSKMNWMNPPYGREISKWIEKAYLEGRKGNQTLALLPARTDTRWFHDYICQQNYIKFIKGRLKFGGAKNPAPFPSMLVHFWDWGEINNKLWYEK